VSPIIWVLLGAAALVIVIAVLLYLHGKGLEKSAERLRLENVEFAKKQEGFRWDGQKDRQ